MIRLERRLGPADLKRRYDAVVIGSGMGGLTAGAFLAKAGRSVLVLEQHYIPGGYCTSFRRKGYSFDVAVHHVSSCGRWGIVGRALSELGVQAPELVPMDPLDHIHFPDFQFDIPADIERFQELLGLEFPAEREGIAAFFKELGRVYRAVVGGRESPTLAKYAQRTFRELLDEHLSAERLKRLLGSQWGYVGLPPEKASAIGMSQVFMSYWRDGGFYPRGGIQDFANAYTNAFFRLGGDLLLKARVRRVLMEAGRVAGVELADGRRIEAPVVVANCGPRQLVEELLPAPSPAVEDWRVRVRELEESCVFFNLWLGLSAEADLAPLQRGYYHFPMEGDVGPWLYLSVPTRADPSLSRHGGQIVSALVALDGHACPWDAPYPFKRRLTEWTLDYLSRFVPDLRAHVVHAEGATPKTAHYYTLNSRGAAYGWHVDRDQGGVNRLPQETPIPGLYLASHWTFPGPGIPAVVASGWGTAKKVLERGA